MHSVHMYYNAGKHTLSAGDILIMFSGPIEERDSSKAEIKIIRKALQVFEVSYLSHLIVEVDSTVAVGCVTKPKG